MSLFPAQQLAAYSQAPRIACLAALRWLTRNLLALMPVIAVRR